MAGNRRDLKTYRWKLTRQTVLERDGFECQIRGPRCQGVANEVDHIIPKAHGGGEGYDNLRAACRPCNAHLGGRGTGATFSEPASTPAALTDISRARTRSGPMRTRVHRPLT